MSINFNDVGRVGKDAETRYTQAGKPVTGWSLAVDSGYGDNKQTLWFDCSAWGERWNKVAPYIVKGAQVQVQGELGTREHDGKTYLTVRVSDLKLVGGRGESSGRGKESKPRPSETDMMDDDIPF
jgi:single-strand DNA-binding protein